MIDKLTFEYIWIIFIIFNISLVALLSIISNATKTILSCRIYSFLIYAQSILVVLLLGLRAQDVGTDTISYYQIYDNYTAGTYNIIKDIGFYLFVKIVSVFGKEYFLFFCAFLFVMPIAYVFTKKTSKGSYLAFVFFISSFYFINMGINVMRQGIAISLVILFFYFYLHKAKKISYILALLSILFHFSVLIVLVSFALAKFLSLRSTIAIYIIAIAISFLGVGIIEYFTKIPILRDLFAYRVDSYLNSIDSTSYNVGFRYDFVIFNTFFLLIGLIINAYISIDNSKSSLLLKLYILLSSIFFLSFYIPFSDRVGVMSWVVIPFVLIPLFDKRNKIYVLLTMFIFIVNFSLTLYL